MRRYTAVLVGLTLVLALGPIGQQTHGHTPIASRFTYNEHIYPIFEDQCGSCHVEGGIAPMSLLTYQEAYPWTQSIREEVLGLRMPPWKAEDGFGQFKNGHVLPAHELDMILEWAAGGYPQGPRDQVPTPPAPLTDWKLGAPTLELTIPEPFALGANTSEAVRYFTMDSGLETDQLITGVEVLPSSRAVVRHVSVYVDTSGTARAADSADPAPGFADGFTGQPVSVWWPGQQVVTLDDVGYTLPAGADVVVRILYKKTWITEGQQFSDQTRLGLHLASNVSPIDSAVLHSQSDPIDRQLTFSHQVDEDLTLLGLLPEVDIDAAELKVEGVRPDGSREPLLLIREPDADWPTRYWFDTPHVLPTGSQIEVTATLRPGAERRAVSSLFASQAPVRLLLDFTSASAAN